MTTTPDATARAVLGYAAAGLLWLGRYYVSNDGTFPAAPASVALDVSLVALQLWAIRPLATASPKLGSAASPTRLLLLPITLAALLALKDIWLIIGLVK